MDYAVLLSFREGLTQEERDEALIQRAAWSYPDGLDVHAEYWLGAEDPAVIVLASAETFGPLFELSMKWADKFAITMHPAVSAEEGLKIGPEAMQRARA